MKSNYFTVYKNRSAIVKALGEIDLNDKAVIGDPCYPLESMGVINHVRPGKYHCYVRTKVRISRLFAFHEDVPLKEIFPILRSGKALRPVPSLQVEEYADEDGDTGFGVDSGQAGIFNHDYFGERDWMRRYQDLRYRQWYQTISYMQDADGRHYGMMDGKCVVSQSGWGDGGYPCYLYKKNNEVVGFALDFAVE